MTENAFLPRTGNQLWHLEVLEFWLASSFGVDRPDPWYWYWYSSEGFCRITTLERMPASELVVVVSCQCEMRLAAKPRVYLACS